MAHHEREHHSDRREGGRAPFALPPELADFLRTQEVACLLQATDRGTAFLVKLPRHEIDSLRGTVPIRVRHELYAHPASPVIRTVLTIYDQPESPMALECFTNIDDPQQQADFAALATQDTLYLLGYDEALSHRLTKVLPHIGTEPITDVLHEAQRLRSLIPDDQFDFDRAKAAVLVATEL